MQWPIVVKERLGSLNAFIDFLGVGGGVIQGEGISMSTMQKKTHFLKGFQHFCPLMYL